MHQLLPLVGAFEFSTLPQQLVNGILLGAIYALIALGYTMVYGVLRLINFAHGEVFMLGAYVALFVSWSLGFSRTGAGAASGQSSALNLAIMLLVSMVVCAIVGMVIELLAYRPMRSQPRIASLITAIGVSLLLQYGGQLFLPNSPPPSIDERVNPFRTAVTLNLVPPSAATAAEFESLDKQLSGAEAAFTKAQKSGKLSPEARVARLERDKVKRDWQASNTKVRSEAVQIVLPQGQVIMLLTTVVLMVVLRHLVLATPMGRAMRAVSHDFESASLMGVSVNKVVTFTFLIGSALAGAGAMMNATFLGTPLTPFYGVQPGVKAFVAAVLGGIGNIPGAVIGGLLMGLAEALVTWCGGTAFKDAIAFVILIAVLIVRPGGILGSAAVEKV